MGCCSTPKPKWCLIVLFPRLITVVMREPGTGPTIPVDEENERPKRVITGASEILVFKGYYPSYLGYERTLSGPDAEIQGKR